VSRIIAGGSGRARVRACSESAVTSDSQSGFCHEKAGEPGLRLMGNLHTNDPVEMREGKITERVAVNVVPTY